MTGTPTVVTVTKTVIGSPRLSITARNANPSSTTTAALDQLDLSTLSPTQALAALTKLKNDHDAYATRKQLFGTARTARPADVALMRSCDSKPLPMIITPDDNGHSMMAALNEFLSRCQTFVTWQNATNLVLEETLSDGTTSSKTLDILVDFPEITEEHLNAIGAARWTTDVQKAKSQDGDSIQFSSTVLLDLIVASTEPNLLRTIKSEAGAYGMDGTIIFVRLAQHIFINRHLFDTALLTNLRLKVNDASFTKEDPLAASYLANIRNFLILFHFAHSKKKLKDPEVYETFFQAMKSHPDTHTNLEISKLHRKFTTDHTTVDPLDQIIHKLTQDNRIIRAQGTALTVASHSSSCSILPLLTITVGVCPLHRRGR